MGNRRQENRARTFRSEDAEWEEALEAAAYNDESISRVIRRALKAYVRTTKAKQAKAEAEVGSS